MAALAASGLAQSPNGATAEDPTCGEQGVMAFLCGIDAAEDSAPIPGTRWLLTGGLGFGQPATIKLVDTTSGTVRALYPKAAANRLDSRIYAECPGPPDAARFSTDGVALDSQNRHRHLFYAVHHGDRESVEVFEIDSGEPTPTLAWIGCILLPEHTNPNAVAPLPGRGLAIVSMDDGAPDRMGKHVVGVAAGTVHEWHPGSGLRALPGARLRGGNGIVASTDGQWVYVSAWSGGAIVRIRRDGSMPATTVELGYLPDNLKWAADGSILVAGQRSPVAAIAGCTGNPCLADWLIAKIDPQTMASRTLVEAQGTPEVNYATGATEIAGSLYITNRGMSRIGVIGPEALKRDGPIQLE